MFRVVLLSCLLAGGLSAKLPSGPEHRTLGHHSDAAHHSAPSGEYSYGTPPQGLTLPGSAAQYQGSGSRPTGSRVAAASFSNNGRPSGSISTGSQFEQRGSAGFSSGTAGFRQSAGSGSTFASASGSRQGSGLTDTSSSAGFRQGGQANSISGGFQSSQAGFRGAQGGQAGFRGAQSAAGFSSEVQGGVAGQYDDGSYRQQNLESQFDEGDYRADELNSAFDDGTYRPSLYSGDDGLYKDDQYAPNTDASYQFEFDAGDHGRQEAADVDGEVEGNFYAVHPDGLRRDVDFTAGVDGFVVTRDGSVQGPVPEYALRAAAKPKKVYPPAEIRTSLSPDGIFHWEYDAGESSRSEDINLNTNYYEGTYDFTADDDQNKYRVDYVAGAGIGFVPTGDHLPQQVEETPEVAAAKADFLDKYSVIEAEAKAALKDGYQQANRAHAAAYQTSAQRQSNFQSQSAGQVSRQQGSRQGYSAARPQAPSQNFRQQDNRQGYSAARPQAPSQNFRQQSNRQSYSAARPQSQTFSRPQNTGQAVRQQASGNNRGYSASQSQSQSFRPATQPLNRPQNSGQATRQSASQGYSAGPARTQPPRPASPTFNRPQNSGQAFRQQANSNQASYSASQAQSQSFRPASRPQQHDGSSGLRQPGSQISTPLSSLPPASQGATTGAGRPFGDSANTVFSGAESGQSFNQVRPQASADANLDEGVHPSMMVAQHALGGHRKTAVAAAADEPAVAEVPTINNSYLPPN